MTNIKVDAMGFQCPIPVVMTTKALKELKEAAVVEVHVDNEVAVQNLLRLAGSRSLPAESEKQAEGHFIVKITADGPISGDVGDEAQCEPCGDKKCASPAGETVVVIGSDTMGSGNDELGKVLIKGFIYAVSQLDKLPAKILFYNGGATIPVEGSASLEDLKALEEKGVEILTCGTCLDYYQLKDKLAVGSVTNMYVIAETLNNAAKIIRP